MFYKTGKFTLNSFKTKISSYALKHLIECYNKMFIQFYCIKKIEEQYRFLHTFNIFIHLFITALTILL